MSREYSTNPRFEDNGDIGSCDNSSDVTNSKVTAIFSDEVGMLTDNPALASTEAESLYGKNVEISIDPISRQTRSKSSDVSGSACSTNKPNENEYCLPGYLRSNALSDFLDKSDSPFSASYISSYDLSDDDQKLRMEEQLENPNPFVLFLMILIALKKVILITTNKMSTRIKVAYLMDLQILQYHFHHHHNLLFSPQRYLLARVCNPLTQKRQSQVF